MADLGTTTATILFTDVVGSTELRGRSANRPLTGCSSSIAAAWAR